VTRRGLLAGLTTLALGPGRPARAAAPPVDMADIRRLAREPVETIFAGAPIGRLTDGDYWKTVRGSPRPVVVVFYANQDERSRNLATLARSLAVEYAEVIGFYGYRVTAGTTVERVALDEIDRRYGVKRLPATLFYDNDHGNMELERTDYSVPAMLEYRTPSMLFWRTYHQAIREYIEKNILD
jgi:hypothetical protein